MKTKHVLVCFCLLVLLLSPTSFSVSAAKDGPVKLPDSNLNRSANGGILVTWLGANGNSRWSDPANWEGGIVPGVDDIAHFTALSRDAIVDPAFNTAIAGIELETDFSGTLRLERSMTVHGNISIAGGTFIQGNHSLNALTWLQTGGEFMGAAAPLWISGSARVYGGQLDTPSAAMHVNSLEILAPGLVRTSSNGKLDLAGDGSPLTGNGELDTKTHLPNSVEFTGHATTDLLISSPLAAAGLPGVPVNKAVPGITADLAAGDPVRVATLSLITGEESLSSAVVDTAAGYAYFGTKTDPGIVVKVRLSDFTRVGALTLNSGEDCRAAVIDVASGYIYIASSGVIVKVRLSDFTRVGALALYADGDHFNVALIDPAAGYAYFISDLSGNRLVKIKLSDFSRAGALTLGTFEFDVNTAMIDTAAGYAYLVVSSHNPNYIVKVRLADITRTDTLTLTAGENWVQSSIIDPEAGYAYLSNVLTGPKASIIKISLNPFVRVGSLTLDASEGQIYSAALDHAAGFAYFGTDGGSVPGTLVKVRLSDFSHAGALSLNANEYGIFSMVIDPAMELLYLGVDYSSHPSRVVKVNLTDQSTPQITSLSPTSALAGGAAFTLTITGTNMATSSTILWGGTAITSTFISTKSLRAVVPAGKIVSAGVYSVTVFTPDPYGGLSRPQFVFVTLTGAGITSSGVAISTNPGGTAIASTGGTGPNTPGSLSATGTGSGTLAVAIYSANPAGVLGFSSAGRFMDIHVEPGSTFTSVSIMDCDMNGGISIYWWNGAVWLLTSNQSYNPLSGCTTVVVTSTTSPSLNDLAGMQFAAGNGKRLFLPFTLKNTP